MKTLVSQLSKQLSIISLKQGKTQLILLRMLLFHLILVIVIYSLQYVFQWEISYLPEFPNHTITY